MSIPDLVHCPVCEGDDHIILDIASKVGFCVVTFRCQGCGWDFLVEDEEGVTT